MPETETREAVDFDNDEDQPLSQRQKLARISHDFAHVPVRVGTQQAGAIETVREAAQLLAKRIAVLCPEGPDTDIALAKVWEAKAWATQAISHRGGGTS
jgi:protein tyrosine phosphatase (PTP) superfamily phosphohydrolase (DUF442 family)